MLQGSPSKWTVLQPTEMKSVGGATLTKLPDDSILASDPNPLGDAYSIVAEANVVGLRVIRLEALTHESLPNRGPGRDGERDLGNFALTDLRITARGAGTPAVPLEFGQVAADYYFLD